MLWRRNINSERRKNDTVYWTFFNLPVDWYVISDRHHIFKIYPLGHQDSKSDCYSSDKSLRQKKLDRRTISGLDWIKRKTSPIRGAGEDVFKQLYKTRLYGLFVNSKSRHQLVLFASKRWQHFEDLCIFKERSGKRAGISVTIKLQDLSSSVQLNAIQFSWLCQVCLKV